MISVKNMQKRLLLCLFYSVTLLAVGTVHSEERGMTPAEVDALIELAMEKFQVPGVSFGLIKDGKIIISKGYGVLEVGKKARVDDETLFAIASNSKAFTAASLAILVDEKKLNWDDKVTDYIPTFQMYDPWVTREFKIRDLLVHNSGLGLGAGDLMFWPSSGFSRKEIVHGLRYLKPISSFRSEYAYDNLMYILAGEVVEAISGVPYERFVETRILKPLDMKNCAADRVRLKGYKNIAEPHVLSERKLVRTKRIEKPYEKAVSAAAGGILCSTKSMLKWVNMHLHNGKLPNGTTLLSQEQHEIMIAPHTPMSVPKEFREKFQSNFKAYGLGFRVQDINGHKWVAHTGGLQGMVSYVNMIPDIDLGFVMFTNQHSGAFLSAVANTLLEAYTSERSTDWITYYEAKRKEQVAEAAKLVPVLEDSAYSPEQLLDYYIGTYRDPWFGKVTISEKNGGLYFASEKSERLRGRMLPYKEDLFIVYWDERELEADAYVKFERSFNRTLSGFVMKAVSPLTDFSFDFQDLDFRLVE
ncbi:serine hydrolase [Emcibacter nanhaiensis]|uniref:Serine hydrolase n=1 Tax=Emcibacter nanhaiensis TaxID=1505037 RepID=A0A501PCN8_9PROT|nr:serine hydrolase [Emcibacter nanhaiensis]TPD57938.1 serine hydrolase [Emcibacter nanhaiensis]